MLTVYYKPEECPHYSNVQKSRCPTLDSGSGNVCHRDCKCQHANWKHGIEEFKALDVSVTTLSQSINVTTVHTGEKQGIDDDTKPAADGKMGANAKNLALKIHKKGEGMTPDLSVGRIPSSHLSYFHSEVIR